MSVPTEIFKKIKDIKPLCESTFHLLEVMSKPEHSVYDVVRIVEGDTELTWNILRIVNSETMGLNVKIKTVECAVSHIGDKMIIGLCLGLCAKQVCDDLLEEYAEKRGILCQHGIRVALAAREIVQYADKKIHTETAYTAGIMHDIGKAAISSFLSGNTQKTPTETEAGEKKDYVAAERDVIGTDHAEVGALLAEHWNLPATLRSVIAYHHKPGKAQEADRPLVYVIHLADVVAKMGGTGTGSDSFLYTLDEHYKEYVSISLVDLGKIYYHTGIEYEKIVAAMFAGK
ncbi:HDOD domain-containing protein [bacterium]|nr:HDOD domain-containing protein [bacterium]